MNILLFSTVLPKYLYLYFINSIFHFFIFIYQVLSTTSYQFICLNNQILSTTTFYLLFTSILTVKILTAGISEATIAAL